MINNVAYKQYITMTDLAEWKAAFNEWIQPKGPEVEQQLQQMKDDPSFDSDFKEFFEMVKKEEPEDDEEEKDEVLHTEEIETLLTNNTIDYLSSSAPVMKKLKKFEHSWMTKRIQGQIAPLLLTNGENKQEDEVDEEIMEEMLQQSMEEHITTKKQSKKEDKEVKRKKRCNKILLLLSVEDNLTKGV